MILHASLEPAAHPVLLIGCRLIQAHPMQALLDTKYETKTNVKSWLLVQLIHIHFGDHSSLWILTMCDLKSASRAWEK